jgi:hypothetical protein
MRKKTHKYTNIIVLIIIIVLIVYMLYYNTEEYENYQESIKKRNLEKDGFCVLHNPKYATETKDYPCEELTNDVLNLLPPGYVFIDYVYKIKNVALSTFHRDVTSSQHIFNTKHTVYTLILYKYDGELLSLCPGSNKTYPFVTSRIVNVSGNSGTAFLFDCDVLHAGRVNNCKERKVIQYKICHKDDLPKLKSLVGVYKEKTEKCVNNLYVKTMRKLSYHFEMPINYFAYPLMTKRENSNSLIGFIQSFIPMSYYNNA